MSRALGFAVCVGLCVAGMVQSGHAQPREPSALSQPFRDIGLVRDQVPPALARAADDPYQTPRLSNDELNCSAITSEISALDDALGPDVDMPQQRRSQMGRWVSGAIRDAVSLPYRGVVRTLSGAERRDAQMRSAQQAGNLRRAFLKGVRDSSCRTLRAPSEEASRLAPHPARIAGVPLQSIERDVASAPASSVPMQAAAAPGAGR